MRPKLKPDAYWVPNEDGMTLVHVTGYLKVSGRSSLELMNRLAPHLDGSNALADLVRGLDPGKREAVTTLVDALAGAGLVKDVSDDLGHGLSAAEEEIYAGEIAYVDYFLDSAAYRFERYRRTPVLCVGAGLTLAALVHSCLATGVLLLHVRPTDACPTDTERIAEYAAAARLRDPAQQVHVSSSTGLDGLPDAIGLAGLSADHGVVLHVSDLPSSGTAQEIDRVCRAGGIRAVHGVPAQDEVWTGPLVNRESAGWTSAWLRRAALLDGPAGPLAEADPPDRSPFLTGPTASIVANRVAFTAFRAVTGITAVDHSATGTGGEVRERLARIDLETLQTTEHWAHPHPGVVPATVGTDNAFRARMAAFRAATMPPGPEFSRIAASMFDPAVGLLAELDEDELSQLPLCVAKVRISDPFRLLDTSAGGPVVIGTGDDMVAARYDAARAALTGYAGLAVDRRTVDDGQVYAHDLVRDTLVRIDAAVAHPVLAARTNTAVWRLPRGLRAGADAAEALQRGLGDHVAALTATEVADGAVGVQLLATDAFDTLGEPTARHAKLLRIAGADVEIRRVVGALGVPVYLGRRDGMTVGCSIDPAEVVVDLLLAEQGLLRPAEVQLPGAAFVLTGPAWEEPPEPLPGWEDLVARLHVVGRRAYAVPGCHDPVLDTVLPTVVQVVVDEEPADG